MDKNENPVIAWITDEYNKCKSSPYYFFTHYWKVNGKPATTPMTEEEFNKLFKSNTE